MRAKMMATLAGLGMMAGGCAPVEPVDGLPAPPPQAVVVEGIAYTAETHAEAATLHGIANVTNTTSQTRQVTFPDACVILLRAYMDPSRTGEPVWDQARIASCAQVLMRPTLQPGQTERYQTTVTPMQILGDSLMTDTYYFSALIRADGLMFEVPAGQAQLTR